MWSYFKSVPVPEISILSLLIVILYHDNDTYQGQTLPGGCFLPHKLFLDLSDRDLSDRDISDRNMSDCDGLQQKGVIFVAFCLLCVNLFILG
jgi:hypothetical protein